MSLSFFDWSNEQLQDRRRLLKEYLEYKHQRQPADESKTDVELQAERERLDALWNWRQKKRTQQYQQQRQEQQAMQQYASDFLSVVSDDPQGFDDALAKLCKEAD